MTHWVRPAAVAILTTPVLVVMLLVVMCLWASAAEIYWAVLQAPHHGETAAFVLAGVDVVYVWMLVFFLLALLQHLEELRIPRLRQLLAAALLVILAFVFVAPCAIVWSLGGAALDVLMIAIASVAGTAGALLWRLGARARRAPDAGLDARTVTPSVAAQLPQPWRAVRLALGAPYAPASWKRRVIELALLCAVLAGPPMLVLCFESSLNPRGFRILLHVAEFVSFVIAIGLCWIWPLARVVALFTSRSGALTELALLPGLGSGRQQLRRLCLVALSVPAGALLVLLLLALGVVALEQLPHAAYVKVALEFLLVPLCTLPPLAGRLTKPHAPTTWAGAIVMFSQTWTWFIIIWTATPGSWHGLPGLVRWLIIATIAVALMVMVGLTGHSLRKLARRPHPFLDVSS